jgi:Carboxypeptidase regulatory-like domain
VECNVHGWMHAVLVVSGHPYYTLTDAHGAFKLADVPPGKYTLKLWHETLGEQTKEVTVNPNAAVKVAFGFKGA